LFFLQEAEEKAKEEEISLSSSKGGKKAAQQTKPVDTDPDGEKLTQVCLLSFLEQRQIEVTKWPILLSICLTG
jgi:hypothetical protein